MNIHFLILTFEEEELGEEETFEGLGRRGGGRGGGGLGGREQETREHGGQGEDDGLQTENEEWGQDVKHGPPHSPGASWCWIYLLC